MGSTHILVIGHSDVGRRVCGLLRGQGLEVSHLHDPSDSELEQVLRSNVDGVAVMLHDDIRALRYALMVEHLRPGIRLFVAMFDRTTRIQLEAAVPNVAVLSPAAIAVPSIVAAALATEAQAIRRKSKPNIAQWVEVRAGDSDLNSNFQIADFGLPRKIRTRGLLGVLSAQGRPYDRGTAVMVNAALGLIGVTLADTLFALGHEPFLTALRDAVFTTATITAPDVQRTPLQELWAATAAISVMALAAAFGAGLVHHLLAGGSVGLFGRRVAPRAGHVIVVGLGQVGLRLCQELRDLGVPVVAVEKSSTVPTLALAKTLRIPVIIGTGTSQATLKRAGVCKALAVVAAGSDERDNIAVAIDVLAAAPNANIVMRAGSDPAIDETRSLFHIATAVDVNALTAAFVVHTMAVQTPYIAVHRGEGVAVLKVSGELDRAYRIAAHCSCE